MYCTCLVSQLSSEHLLTVLDLVEDTVLATAALKGNARAWHDLEQVFSQPLTRTCTLHLSDQGAPGLPRGFLSAVSPRSSCPETRESGVAQT